jgi:hypothetical protein
MQITFTNPVTIGADLSQQITVATMEVITISFNFKPLSGNGNVIASITLRDPISGYQQHFTYEDTTFAPQLWSDKAQTCGCGCNNPWPLHIVQKLITDGRVPQGTLS